MKWDRSALVLQTSGFSQSLSVAFEPLRQPSSGPPLSVCLACSLFQGVLEARQAGEKASEVEEV